MTLFAVVHADASDAEEVPFVLETIAPFDGTDIAAAELEVWDQFCDSKDDFPTPEEWLADQRWRVIPIGWSDDQIPEAT